jgi:hypothetical protein
MTETDFDEASAPYADQKTFAELWNAMTPDRRRNNVGLFCKAFNRIPTETEIEQGVSCSEQ